MPKALLPTGQILHMLAEAPEHIEALTADVSPTELRTAPSSREWSANDVLAHIRACADMWGGKIIAMINEDRPTWRAMSPVKWIKQTDYLDLEFRPSLRAFATQRAELLTALEALSPEGWSRSAVVVGAGKPLHHYVHFEAEAIARHDRLHVKQIRRIVNAIRA